MKRGAAILLVAMAVASLGLGGEAAALPSLLLPVAEPEWRPLAQWRAPGLQAALAQALQRRILWRSLVSEGRLAVGVVDLADVKAPRFAAVNGNTMMYAASLPKLAILLAALQGFEDGTLRETPEIHRDLVEMIRRSDNDAANRLIARLGLKRITRVILEPRHRFYDAKGGGGLWLGSAYGRAAEQYPEPLQDLLHAATVDQVCRFYYLLAYGRLINPPRSRQMLKVLAFPDVDDKFVHALKGAVPLPRLYRKSGTWKIWQSDSILVWGESWRRYILVALVAHDQGEQVLRELVPVVEGLLKSPLKSGRTQPSPGH
jgi:beta-lactamase class A